MKNAVFCDVAPCRSCVNRRFGGTYRLHVQGRKIRERGTSFSRWLQPSIRKFGTRWRQVVSSHSGRFTSGEIFRHLGCGWSLEAIWKLWRRGKLFLHREFNYDLTIVQSVARTPLWSSGQSSWLQIQRYRVRFPALPDFYESSGSGTGSTQPREDN
jgi:hypothetical protein